MFGPDAAELCRLPLAACGCSPAVAARFGGGEGSFSSLFLFCLLRNDVGSSVGERGGEAGERAQAGEGIRWHGE